MTTITGAITHVSRRLRSLSPRQHLRRAVDRPLDHPEHVDRGEDDAEDPDDREPAVRREGPQQDEELADERRQAGHDSADRPATNTAAPSQGATLATPPKSSTIRDPRREPESRQPEQRPVENPWLTMYRVAPEPPWVVNANTKCDEAEVRHRRVGNEPLQILWPIASSAPYRCP